MEVNSCRLPARPISLRHLFGEEEKRFSESHAELETSALEEWGGNAEQKSKQPGNRRRTHQKEPEPPTSWTTTLKRRK